MNSTNRSRLHASGPDALSRRQILKSITLSAAAVSLGDTIAVAQDPATTASAKVRAVLESIVRDTPEVGLQAVAQLQQDHAGEHDFRQLPDDGEDHHPDNAQADGLALQFLAFVAHVALLLRIRWGK